MGAENRDGSFSASEIRELRRLIAAERRSGHGLHPLAVTFSGVFAAGFLALFGWMAFETHANSAAVAVLQTDVAVLQAGQRELKADIDEVKADIGELKAGQAELKASVAAIWAGQRELRAILLERQRE